MGYIWLKSQSILEEKITYKSMSMTIFQRETCHYSKVALKMLLKQNLYVTYTIKKKHFH